MVALTCVACLALASSAFADFDVISFDGAVSDQGGNSFTQAGGHPFAASTTIEFATKPDPSTGNPVADGNVKDIHVELPSGLVGNPTAVPRCTQAEFFQKFGADCPIASQVGVLTVTFGFTAGPTVNEIPVYNLDPPPGVPAEFGFVVANNFIVAYASVRSGSDYGVDIDVRGTNQALALNSSTFTFWGVPADPSHDFQRCRSGNVIDPSRACPAGIPPRAFLSLPTSCLGPQLTTLRANSWQDPGSFVEASFLSHDNLGNPIGATGCGILDFTPSIRVQPTSQSADSPTGLHVDLRVPQNDNPNGLAEAHLKKAVVQLPAGMAVNPSAADGLAGCSPAQVDLSSPDPAACPEASKIGTVEINSPLIDHQLDGSVFLATQGTNPFNSLLALYIAVSDPETGLVVKLPGKVEPDPITGQLTTTFDNNPQLPFTNLQLDLKQGSRAPLVTPPSCGTYQTQSTFSPWSAADPNNPTPEETRTSTDSFQITSGPGGGPCPSGDFKPSFGAGTATPLAGGFSPLGVKASRPDGSQLMRGLNLDLPPGLTGKLAGIATCPDSALAAAAANKGAAELASPSCPAASRLGGVNAGAGAGPTPFHVPGSAYLAGPYKGAPLSIAVITPAVAGPFDLGTVVVRAAAQIDPRTAQIHVRSDQLPTILQGIPLHLRSVSVNTDRPDFTLNPTSCNPMSLDGTIFGSPTPAAVANRFQVGGCKGLDFAPKLSLKVSGGTKRGKHPALRAVLRAKPGEANIAKTVVALPHSEFLDQAHIKTVCTRVQFAAKACPAGSIYGHARAITPLLDYALEGPVYLRSSSNKLPDLVAALRGPARQPIEIDLDGRIDSIHGGIRTSFEAVPDAPISKFVLTMRGAKNGLLVNSTNICRRTHKAAVKIRGQNGKVHNFTSPLKAPRCGKKARKKR
jgi:hypothetical protein